MVAVCTRPATNTLTHSHTHRRMTPPLISSAFAGEYLIWAVAPIPFTLPWVAWQHYSLPPSAGGVLRSILYVDPVRTRPPSSLYCPSLYSSITRSHRLECKVPAAHDATRCSRSLDAPHPRAHITPDSRPTLPPHPPSPRSRPALASTFPPRSRSRSSSTPEDWTTDTVRQRLAANVALWLLSYATAFLVFHAARFTGAARFKFNPKVPPVKMILAEVCRSFGGILVLTAYQCFALAKVVASPAADAAAPGMLEQAKWMAVVALWADTHFYATHRFMHTVPALYRLVHKTHHLSRNTDPWSGLSMHPLEHLVYFSAVFLGLLVPGGVPFWVTNLLCIALTVYPIPAHIG